MKKQFSSFKYAFKGIFNCIINEGHFRFDLVAAAYVIYFSARFYSLSKLEWAALVFTISIVLLCEAFNTAIEGICDKITLEFDKRIEFVKDTSAGAVLISAIMSVAVAFLILFDIETFKSIYLYFISHIPNLIILLCTAAVSVAFIIINPKGKK